MSAFNSLYVLPKPVFPTFETNFSDDDDYVGFDSVEMNQDYFSSEESLTEAKANPLLFSTSLQTPSALGTPEKVKALKRVICEYDFDKDGEPFGTPKKLFAEGISALNGELTDTPVKKQKSTQSRIVGRLFEEEIVGKHLVSNPIAFHKKAYEIAESSPTIKKLVEAIVQADRSAQHKALSLPIPKEIINIKHLIEADKRGFHLCLPDDPMFPKLSDIRTAYNTVFQANFPVDSSSRQKCSTFFPVHGVDELVQVIYSAETIATIGNRYLCRVPEQTYLIEMYKSGPLIKSAFPIFFYQDWEPNCFGYPIVCGEQLVLPSELLEKARSSLVKYSLPSANPNPWNPIRYTIGTDLIIDLAPSLSDLGVKQGIFIKFPKSCFEDLIAPDILEEMCKEP